MLHHAEIAPQGYAPGRSKSIHQTVVDRKHVWTENMWTENMMLIFHISSMNVATINFSKFLNNNVITFS